MKKLNSFMLGSMAFALAAAPALPALAYGEPVTAIGSGGNEIIYYGPIVKSKTMDGTNSIEVSLIPTSNINVLPAGMAVAPIATVAPMAVTAATAGSVTFQNYPGAPNTGGSNQIVIIPAPMVGPNTFMSPSGVPVIMTSNGMVRITGTVTTVTPTALGIISGRQTWSVKLAAGMTGQFMIGDIIQVDGSIDSLYSSQINAGTIAVLNR